MNFVNPETFLKHRLSLMEIFSKDQEWLTLQISKGNAHGENPQQGGYLSSESSLEYEPEHGADETWAEKNGNLHFIKEWNVSFDAMALLAKPFNLNSNKKGPKVLIYHTHPSEAYMPSSELMTANSLAPIGKVNQVGERIASGLQKKYGIEVIHNTTLHDRPELKYAYGKALTTVENILKSYPSIKVVLDIHRDGLAGVEKFRPTVQWQGKDFAKVMMVVGTNVTGLQHPQWTSNLTFAMHMQQKLEEMVPGITRPIYISKYRYNQHVANQAIIIEVGGDGNSMMEALASADILSQGIGSFFKK